MLKVTSDGRKLGLDQRLINPLFPDNPESKVNLCVNNVFRIWQEGQAEKLTQLVFCDLSTPKAAAAAKDKTAMAAGNKMTGGTELHALENLLEDIKPDPPFTAILNRYSYGLGRLVPHLPIFAAVVSTRAGFSFLPCILSHVLFLQPDGSGLFLSIV